MGRVAMCGVPAHNLDLYVERLRDKYDVAIAGVSEQSGEFTVVTLPSIDREAERAIDSHEAEYGADGFRAFRDEEQIAAAEAEPEYSDVEALAVADMNEYNALKERRPDDLVFYQIGDAFEVYGEDANKVAALLGVEQTTRALSGTGRVNAVVLPLMKHREYAPTIPEEYAKRLCAQSDLVFSVLGKDGERFTYTRLSQAHEAKRQASERAEDASVPEQRPAPIPQKEKLTQEDIDDSLRTMFPSIEVKRAVVRYMKEHGREKDTAAWLASQYYGGDVNNPLQITLPGPDGDLDHVALPWPKVQRRIAQLIKAEKFYTPEEYDRMDDVDPVAIRERLAESGIVGGEVVDPDKLNNNAFVRQVMADAERVAQENHQTEAEPERDPLAPAYKAGDTVYLENTAYEITEVSDYNVQLKDPTLFYPVFRSENRRNFEDMLHRDARNGPITEYLAANLRDADSDLQDALTWDGGLLENRDKELIVGWIRAGEGNTKIAQRLSETYAGRSDTMTMQTGETLDYYTSTTGIEINIQDKYSTKRNFPWAEAARILRAKFQQERDGFYHDPEIVEPVNLTGAPIYQVGDTVVVPYPDRDVTGTIGYIGDVDVRIDTGPNSWNHEVINRKYFEYAIRHDQRNAHLFQSEEKEPEQAAPEAQGEEPSAAPATTVYPAVKNGLPYDIVIQTIPTPEPVQEPEPVQPAEPPATENFRITDDHLGEGGPKAKYHMNVEAIRTLKKIEEEGRQATASEQEILSRYVGWGGIPDAFDEDKEKWSEEYRELKGLLTDEEYRSARASTLNAHYTSPTVIKAVYEAVANMGFTSGNILEPSCGVGNFFGLLPDSMSASKLYGVELDSITGRIAQQLYPKARINVRGYEKTDYPRDFFDLAIGNVPFGQYKVNDPAYNKLGFSIHNYFFAKALDQVRPGGVVAFITSRYTLDAQDPSTRQYLAKRAKLLGAIRLPNNAFRANAGTDVVSDIIFLQKSDAPIVDAPEWTGLGENGDGFSINRYFLSHPEMVLGTPTSESTQYGRQDYTVAPIPGADLAEQLREAITHINGEIREVETVDLSETEEGSAEESIPADPAVRNFSYTVVDGKVYYRQNSVMVKPDLPASTVERVKGMVELRDCVHHLIALQMDGSDALEIYKEQQRLNKLYDAYTAKYGLINSRGNSLAFSADSAYYLLCSLEVLDEDGNLERKGDFFTKRTIKQHTAVTSVDTSSEALAVSIAEKAKVDMDYMMRLTGKTEKEIFADLKGVIFLNPMHGYAGSQEEKYLPADEYLSGNIREKLEWARRSAELSPDDYAPNVEALTQALPEELDASEIDVRLGATWVDKKYIQQFMYETFKTPNNLRSHIRVKFSTYTAEWSISGKTKPSAWDVMAYTTYGTDRANAYRVLEDTLNLRDVRIYDTIKELDGKERRVLNQKETTLAQQKQQAVKDAFRDWVWKDPQRRHELVQRYNEQFNSTRPREYDGRHITFGGINPEIVLREHQLNAIAHVLYGGNTLLAHEVGAGKTFEMVAAAMESKRLGLCQKSLFAVPNHLVEQWSAEFLRLYPSANILVATKKDFEKANRKKFCARIATGDYDAIIMGHSQFERLPVSYARREHLLKDQIAEIEAGIEELEESGAEKFSVKQLERTKRSLEARLEKLHSAPKDDVVTFEQLGVDRLFIDEAHAFKNLFLCLIGPLAGVGDPIFWGTLRPVLAALGAGIALTGSI
ncbi:MAG: PTS system mannose/fructose/sorbose family transporter subunit IID, partial [Oscillospiraceae bacterium]|nr:PTS system mannose/fructose/sorbose family transporter subunit IID [Oscillospiraceae bacterium]